MPVDRLSERYGAPMKFFRQSFVSILVAGLCTSVLALTFSSPAGAETGVDDGLVPDKELVGTESNPPSPATAPESDTDESDGPATDPSLPNGNETDTIDPLFGPDEAPVGQQAPVCGTHEHYQFGSGYACNSPYDPEPRVPSKCPVRVFEILVPILLRAPVAGVWGPIGVTTILNEAGFEEEVTLYGWITKPQAAVWGEVYRTVREEACESFGYSS